MNRISDLFHAFIPVTGIAVALQAPITAYLISAGAPIKVVDLAFGAIGLLAAGWSKYTDSKHDVAVQTAQPVTPTATHAPFVPTPVPPSPGT